ncbi:hypothetical protein C882_3322 [Caenispirillum salinarum AK4]|uniref:EamA domain-containing protein n=1 Tax=Caenispirillum salinarum AK4 TaxID=1238182 RepID=K9GJ83_9PROT|nr:hypothetical protein [Caenispirillum salinarum]EKV26035.1 hypothetical protein C882_3322 [Caenispirillum salinarum AK4]
MLLGWFMVAMTIILTVFGQIIVKWQIAKAAPPAAKTWELITWVFQMALNPWLILVFVMVFTAGGAWFVAMSRLPLSHTYPVMGLTFPLVVIGSALLLGERVSLTQAAGTALVVTGVVVLGYAATR